MYIKTGDEGWAINLQQFPPNLSLPTKVGNGAHRRSENQALGFKRNKQKCNFHYAALSMMMSQILKFVDFTKKQKSTYVENETLFFLRIKKIH